MKNYRIRAYCRTYVERVIPSRSETEAIDALLGELMTLPENERGNVTGFYIEEVKG